MTILRVHVQQCASSDNVKVNIPVERQCAKKADIYHKKKKYVIAAKCHHFTTFLKTPYGTLNDEHDNDYMIN